MKKLLALALVAMMAGGATAQVQNGMGIFFNDSVFDETTTTVAPAVNVPFDMYLVLIAAEFSTIGGYECGIEFSVPGTLILAVGGSNGWTNFGDNTNHLVGYTVPRLPVDPDGTAVLATLNVMRQDADAVDISLGPADPSSVGGAGPAIADGGDPDILRTCHLTTDAVSPGVVANFNGVGIVATESSTLTDVKALFD